MNILQTVCWGPKWYHLVEKMLKKIATKTNMKYAVDKRQVTLQAGLLYNLMWALSEC